MRVGWLRRLCESLIAESGIKLRFGQKNQNVKIRDLGVCGYFRFVSANSESNICLNRQFVPDSGFATERPCSRLRRHVSRGR